MAVIGHIEIFTAVERRRNELGQFISHVESGAAAGIQEIADIAEQSLRAFFSTHFQTGETLASISVVTEGATSVRVSVGGAAGYLEFGTGGHPIVALGKALYSAERDFGPVRRVDHPGNPAYGAVAESRAEAEAVGESIMEANLPKG